MASLASTQAFTIRNKNSQASLAASAKSDHHPSAAGLMSEIEEEKRILSRQQTAREQSGGSSGDELQPHETRDDGEDYPTGLKLSLIALALCLSVFLMALDNSIIATAIPKITDEFHSLPDVGWYGSAYLLTTSSLQLLFGRLYTFLSLKWVFLAAIVVFEVGSLICGVSPSSVTLIVGRAVAGVGGAGIYSGALLILAHSVPLAKRPLFSGFIGGMYGIASVAGPLLGGVFTDKLTWRWCFYINLPIGAVTLFVIAFFFPDPPAKSIQAETLAARVKRFDPVGTVIFMPAIICLLLALQWGGTTYDWENWRIIVLFVIFGLLIFSWIGLQVYMGENATVPVRIIKDRSVLASSLFSFGIGASFFVYIYYVPIWFQAVQGVSAVNSGIRNLPMLIAVVILSIASGAFVSLVGYYAPLMILGTVLASVGGGLLTTWEPDTSRAVWIGYQVLYGAGVGLSLQQPIMAVQTVLELKDIPVGTAVVVFMQTLGGALCVSIAQNVFSNELVKQLAKHVPSVNPSAVLAAGATSLRHTLSSDLLPAAILAYSNALTTAFFVGVAMAIFTVFGSALIEWKSVKGKKLEMGMA
ncbi:putative efflux pump [Xylariaceae sp. FL0804]|nr:putative efflux pump [Xylariaceae sp. FL0804]